LLLLLCNAIGVNSDSTGSCYNSPACIHDYQSNITACPGRYCGRPYSNGQITSEQCQACPRGYKTDHWGCLPCQDSLSPYDIMYIVFMVGSVLVFHLSAVSITKENLETKCILLASAFGETLVSIVATVLLFEPRGRFLLYSCSVNRLSDWYPIFSNPPTYHCASEAAYPLFSLILMFYAFAVALTIIVRIAICHRYCAKDGDRTVYFSLYLFPVLMLVHVIMSGLIYYSYPYLILVGTIVVDVAYFLRYNKEIFTTWYIAAQLIVFYLASVFALMAIVVFFQTSWFLSILAVILPLIPPMIFLGISKQIRKLIRRFRRSR